MASTLLTAPAVEPLTLAEAKAWLRVEHDDEDDLIATLITAARAQVEAVTRRALITQHWRVALDAWPGDGRIVVTPAPLQALLAARIFDADGEAQEIDPQSFVVDTASAPGVIAFVPWAVPIPDRAVGGIALDIACGYGDTAADVPEPLRQAIRVLLAQAYENRAETAVPHARPSLAALLAPYRVVTL